MMTTQFLYQSHDQLYQELSSVDEGKACLIQIFTNALHPAQGVLLAQRMQALCPHAKVIGSSVSGVIYQGEQYDNHTLVVVEAYDSVEIATQMVSLEDKAYGVIAEEIHTHIGEGEPGLLRLFVGGYYDYAHQLIQEMNELRPELKIVGGMSGEIQPDPEQTPYVFDAEQWLAQGLVFCTLQGKNLMVYGRINTAHEPIGQVYTITQARDRAILEIEGEPAQAWLQRNFGVLSTKEYKTWEEIAQNDPLVRLQLALEEHNRSIRFIHYNEVTQEISQYFSRLPSGSQFRISYTSPSKCAEETADTCREVATTPIEQLFCYSCLFRKLYLKNCAKWELTPYHENPVSGVFLLGEFGYSEDGNTLLNGSSVMSGLAEREHYLSVDMSCLDALEDIRDEDEKLMDYIIRNQRKTESYEHKQILDEMIAHESNHLINPYQRIDLDVPVGDLSKYELDKEVLCYNKLCMIRIENADVFIGQMGQVGYFSHLKMILEQLMIARTSDEALANIHFYSIKSDTFLVACSQAVDRTEFLQYIHKLQKRCDKIQKSLGGMPFLLRFVLARNHPFLLDRVYAIMESCRNSQLPVITDDGFEAGELTPVEYDIAEELSCIQLIHYALEHDKVIPYYQGLYNNQTGEIDRYEALMRLCDRDGRIYAPPHFMEIAKKYRLYLGLNLKMFQAVLRDFSQVDCPVSINFSVHDILSPRFCQEMRTALHSFHKPSNLTFELLEDECLDNSASIQTFITEVRSYGVNIAVDDFGAGYSNLLEIAKIRPDSIKIDGQIISNLGKAEGNEAILEAVALLGKGLSINLVAECVENLAIQSYIQSHDITYSQGFLFAKPQPFEVIYKQIQARKEAQRPTPPPIKASPATVKASAPVEPITHQRDFIRAIESLSTDLLFRLDLRTGQMSHFGSVQEEMGIPPIMEHFPQSAFDAGMVAPEDEAAMRETIQLMRQGVEKSGRFRIYNQEKIPNWYRMDYKLILDQRNVPIEAIGKLINIQQQKDLEERINTDPLTGCLQKSAFETLVADYMYKYSKDKGILFIVDLDNFKAVNDNLGHQFGDRVLRGVGQKLRALFRGNDFVGRIGGDEFMVMMIGTANLDLAKRKASEILSALDTTYTGTAQNYHLSASIGIATYPQQGDTFQTLYNHADMALFDTKNRGKNGFVIYHDTLSKGTMENTLPFEVAARTLAQHYDPQVVEETFNLLFETKELELSIQAVLELIGTRFGVSRCYIFEQHPTIEQTYQNTYEWCNDGISEEKSGLQAVPLSVVDEFYRLANGSGVLYCNDLSMLQREDSRAMMQAQGIQSFLQTFITSDNVVSYTIGVDECTAPRIWTPIEVSTIMQTSKIIAQFLSYKNTVKALEHIASNPKPGLHSV